jgi:hypothetical protein
MFLKLHENGKMPLPKATLRELEKYNAVLENHPEAIEKIVRQRAKMVRFTRGVCPNIKIMSIHKIIFEKVILDAMFMAELIEPPKFDNFDIYPHLKGNTMGVCFQDDMSNAVVKIVDKK